MTKTIPEARAVTAIRQVSDLNQLALTLHRWGRAAGLHRRQVWDDRDQLPAVTGGVHEVAEAKGEDRGPPDPK